MASERQIAANRLNARKSTGPRSRAGKRRASRNAYRHGLASSRKPDAATARKLDQLARQIAGDSNSEIILELARSAAEAELDLARVRLASVALINRVSAFGAIDPFFDELAKDKAKWQRLRAELRHFRAELRHFKARLSGAAPQSPVHDFIDSTENMPTQEPERTAEAVRRALLELVKLNRYQVRAASRRNRAIKEIIKEIIKIKSN
jgi:CRISPR/Cas system-associated exonuclease Cas4 (RecB family)